MRFGSSLLFAGLALSPFQSIADNGCEALDLTANDRAALNEMYADGVLNGDSLVCGKIAQEVASRAVDGCYGSLESRIAVGCEAILFLDREERNVHEDDHRKFFLREIARYPFGVYYPASVFEGLDCDSRFYEEVYLNFDRFVRSF